MKKLSVLIAKKHTTSISIEDEFLSALKQIAQQKNISINQLITLIDEEKEVENLSSAIRIYILKEYQNDKHEQN